MRYNRFSCAIWKQFVRDAILVQNSKLRGLFTISVNYLVFLRFQVNQGCAITEFLRLTVWLVRFEFYLLVRVESCASWIISSCTNFSKCKNYCLSRAEFHIVSLFSCDASSRFAIIYDLMDKFLFCANDLISANLLFCAIIDISIFCANNSICANLLFCANDLNCANLLRNSDAIIDLCQTYLFVLRLHLITLCNCSRDWFILLFSLYFYLRMLKKLVCEHR